MERLASDLATRQVTSVFVYTREAHPGERHPHLTSFDQKLSNAGEMARTWNMRRRMLVDDLDGTVHRAYGMLPNMTYVLARRGIVSYRASWTDADMVRVVAEHLVHDRELLRERRRVIPYYAEWYPGREVDRGKFLQGLLDAGGVQSLEEYIDAIEQVRGPAEGAAMRKWWERRRG